MGDPKAERAARWSEFTRNVRVMQFLGEISDKNKTPSQQRQYAESRDYVRENFDDGVRMMADNLFGEMQLDFDETAPGQFFWLSELIQDEKLKSPRFPSVFTPAVVQELIVQIYGAQTTVASTLEEIEPAYKKWLDFENRVKLMYKAACGLEKEWQTESLFMIGYSEDMFRMVRRLGEFVAAFRIRLDQLVRAYEALSRIITVMEMNPTEALVRRDATEDRPVKSEGFTGKKRSGFGNRS